jgi:hypothetical protein
MANAAVYTGLYGRILRSQAFRSGAITKSSDSSVLTLEQYIAAVAATKADVEARLSKYTPSLSMNRDSASKAIRNMEAWSNDFGPAVSSLPPESTIPDAQQPKLAGQEARDMVSAVFFDGSYGFHFYVNGTIQREIAEGRWTEAQAREDLDGRMRAFKLLTAMDEDGGLSRIYQPAYVAGFGDPVVIPSSILYTIVTIAIAALVGGFVYLYFDKRDSRERQWDALMKLCDQAGKSGDKESLSKCAEAVKPPAPPNDPIQTAVYVLGGVLALYVVGYYVLPKFVATRG